MFILSIHVFVSSLPVCVEFEVPLTGVRKPNLLEGRDSQDVGEDRQCWVGLVTLTNVPFYGPFHDS